MPLDQRDYMKGPGQRFRLGAQRRSIWRDRITLSLVLTLGIFLFAYPAAWTGWVNTLHESFVQQKRDLEALDQDLNESVPADTATPAEGPVLPTEQRSEPTRLPPGFDLKNPEAPSPAEESANLDQLRGYMLGLINSDRHAHGLTPVILGNNSAAQAHAEDKMRNNYGSHWGLDGLTPYMRYTLAGGINYEAENGADPVLEEGLPYGQVSPMKSLRKAQEGLMDSPGHRRNILDKWHKKVNLGIACDEIACSVVQQFEGDYVEFSETPTISKGILRFAGGLRGPFTFDGAQIWYDQPPHPLTPGQLHTTRSYLVGQQPATFLRKPATGRSYYPDTSSEYSWQSGTDPYLIDPETPRAQTVCFELGADYKCVRPAAFESNHTATVPWTTATVWGLVGQSFQIEAEISAVVNDLGPGVYTVIIWGKADGESVALTNYSIFVGQRPIAKEEGGGQEDRR